MMVRVNKYLCHKIGAEILNATCNIAFTMNVSKRPKTYLMKCAPSKSSDKPAHPAV